MTREPKLRTLATAAEGKNRSLFSRGGEPRSVSGAAAQTRTNAGAGAELPSLNDAAAFRSEATPRQEVQIHLDLGASHEEQGRLDLALTEYRSALDVCERGDRTAQKKYAQGDRITPALIAQAHRQYACCLDEVGRFSESERHYRTALVNAPRDGRIWNDLGYSFQMRGKWSDAEVLLRRAVSLSPEDATARTNLGMTLAALGKVPDALAVLRQVASEDAAHAAVGYVLSGQGNLEAALREYQTAQRIKPDHNEYLTTCRQLQSRISAQKTEVADANAGPNPDAEPSDRALQQASHRAGIPRPSRLSAPPVTAGRHSGD